MLDYKDVALIPRIVSDISSRDDIDLSLKLGEYFLSCPIIASPMKDVVDHNTATIINEFGGLAILHRFCTVEEQVETFIKSNRYSPCAVGVQNDDLFRLETLYKQKCRTFCIDVANGASTKVSDFIKAATAYMKDLKFIVGNVASGECYEWCDNLPNVIAVRVGIGGSPNCTTSNATGIYHPAISLITECAKVKDRKTRIIADGGIKEPGDMCKAIAAGADFLMLGSQIAKCEDSPAELRQGFPKPYKIVKGSASYENQKLYKNNEPRYIEGKSNKYECDETLLQMLHRYMCGLRSSMSYFNAKSLREFRQNASFVLIIN